MLAPVVARRQQSPEHDVSGMDLEWKQWIINGPVEAEAGNDGSQVSACTHQSGHNRELLLVHERDNAVAGPFRHLDKKGEEDEHCQRNIPWLRVVHQAEAEQEDGLEEEGQELRPNAATEADILEQEVTGDSPQGPGKEVHQAKCSRQGRSICRSHLEVGPEVGRQLIVHRELSSEACRILHDHHQDSDILQDLNVVPQRRLLCLASHRYIETLGCGGVPAQELHADGANNKKDRRNNHHHPSCPSLLRWHWQCQ